MNNDKIKCPKCGFDIPMSEVLQHRLQDQISRDVEFKLQKEKEKLEDDFKLRLQKESSENFKILKERLAIESKKRETAEQKELDFLKKQTELEDKIKYQNLEIARKLAEERKLISEKTEKEVAEKFELQNAQMQKQLDDTKKALGEAQRKAAQGSMQTQGEVLELALEDLLRQNFPNDEISAVPKGITGADIIQKVISKSMQECGLIAWESKQTKTWTDEWVQKLKDDGSKVHANILVLVSTVLPKNINNIGVYNGIWVTNFQSVIGLTMALRSQLISTQKVISSQENKNEKKDILYDYLSSQTFASHIEIIVENFLAMKNNLEKEKIAMQKIWTSREIQVNRVIENTAKMYGEISGIAGSNLPSIELLELSGIVNQIDAPKIKSNNKKLSDNKNNQNELF